MNEPAQNSKIIRLTSENVKRLHAVEITPTGNVIVVAGKNGQGKTSVMDSIMYALGGASTFAKQPVRTGEDKAKIVVELDDLTITRTITANGNTSLVVAKKDGARYGTPQAILDGLVGKLSFDPLEFSRQKPEVQAETLRRIAGLDFKDEENQSEDIFAKRTIVNREVKSLEAQIAALPAPRAGLPDAEVSTAEVLERQEAATAWNAANQRKVNELALVTKQVKEAETLGKINDGDLADVTDQIAALIERQKSYEQKRERIQKEIDTLKEQEKSLNTEVSQLQDKPLEGFKDELTRLEETNKLVRGAAQRKTLQAQLQEKTKLSTSYTKKLEALDEAKTKKIRDAKMPIPGLSVNKAGDVLFNDLPLEQASSAEQLRVSVAIGIALNPKLRVLLVRDGSLLDDTSRALLLDLAKEHDAQVWLEQVGTAGDVSVIIEDGMVKV